MMDLLSSLTISTASPNINKTVKRVTVPASSYYKYKPFTCNITSYLIPWFTLWTPVIQDIPKMFYQRFFCCLVLQRYVLFCFVNTNDLRIKLY